MADDETKAFLKELETKHDGTISWKTYATWFGSSKGIIREFGVFLYRINDTFYYEDFERKTQFLGIPLNIKKSKNEYKKMEGAFNVNEIESTLNVSKNVASNFLQGANNINRLKQIGSFQKFFSQVVTMVTLKDGTKLFFELMNIDDFNKNIKIK